MGLSLDSFVPHLLEMIFIVSHLLINLEDFQKVISLMKS